jgi:amino acid adenylation domain-containing protein
MDDKRAHNKETEITVARTASVAQIVREDHPTFPLSPVQEELWKSGLTQSSGTRNAVVRFRLHGRLDRQALRAALDLIVARHDILRATFRDGGFAGVQANVMVGGGFGLAEQNVNADEVVENIQEHEESKAFDVFNGPLIRGRLLIISAWEHVLLISQHPLIFDSASAGVLTRELGVLYAAFAEGGTASLPPPILQYGDYARRQKKVLTAERLKSQIEYWIRSLADTPQLLQLPRDRPCCRRGEARARSRIEWTISADMTNKLQEKAREQHATLSEVLLSVWAVLLGRWCGQDDIVIGIRIANRRHPGSELLLGPVENFGAVRIRLHDELTSEQLLAQVRSTLLEVHANQDVPFGRVLEALKPTRGEDPVFQVSFDMNEGPAAIRESLRHTCLSLSVSEAFVEYPSGPAQAELFLSVCERENALIVTLDYARDLFDFGTIERMAASWQPLLEATALANRQPVGQWPMLAAAERHRVLYGVNNTRTDYSSGRYIHELFEDQVRRTPDRTALVYRQQSLTYAELNGKANQLAWYLRDRGVGPDDLVALCVERSEEMVVGMLAILKAGGAYVPLDPLYPVQRLRYMLQDCAPRVLLTQAHLTTIFSNLPREVVAIDADRSVISGQSTADRRPSAVGLSPANLAFVIYTSGSTGMPKGAMNEHRGMANRILAARHIEAYCEQDICCQKTSVSFVDAVFEIFGALCNGKPLLIVPATSSDSERMAVLIAEQQVTQLITVPSLARSMSENAETIRNLSRLRNWTLSGEEVRPDLLIKLQHQLPTCEFITLYGASEVSSDATFYKTKQFAGERVPIGWPVPNTQVYVLDPYGEPVPTGVVGEIHVGGAGVGRGYLNRPELTAARFIPDRFNSDSPSRLYKTGDLGRWRADGLLEYLGRNDHQVKIRGFRIELGEIEAQLLHQSQIREAVVVARDERGEKRLIAYVTARVERKALDVEALRLRLKNSLPGYMVPAAIVVIDTLPRTPNGKLDRRALPAPGPDAYSHRVYEAPKGTREETVARIWQDLLKVEHIGRLDNFFEQGGHSLLLVQMLESLRRAGFSPQVRDIYANETLSDLARALVVSQPGAVTVSPTEIPPGCPTITPAMLSLIKLSSGEIALIANAVHGGATNIQDIYPLTPLQEGILFHHVLSESVADAYILQTLLSFSSDETLKEFVQALQHVIERHDVLRTAVLWERLAQPVQVVCRKASVPIARLDLSADKNPLEELQRRMGPDREKFNLGQAPLIRLQVVPAKGGPEWFGLLQTHHLIGDNESQELMIAEVIAHVKGRAHELPRPAPYHTHVANVLAHAQSQDAEAFFRAKLGDINEPTAPFGLVDVHGDGSWIDESRQVLEPDLARRIRQQARHLKVSTATLCHAAWALVVSRTSGRNDVVYGTVLLGRFQGNAGAQRTLGLFINTLPLRVKLHNVSAEELVENTQTELVELLNVEQSSLAVAQRCSGVPESVPLFNSLLNYLHGTPGREAEESLRRAGIKVLATRESTNYPITLSVTDTMEQLELLAQTDSRVAARRVVGYLIKALQSLVEALETAPETPALALSILPEDERQQVIEAFNSLKRAYPDHKLIHELFEEQVCRTPDAIALVHEEQSLTYAELNRRANQLAHYLRGTGVPPDQLVAICLDRGAEMVVSVLGILKAGAAYIPLDPNYPSDRLRYMLEDAGPWAVLTRERLKRVLPQDLRKMVVLDEVLSDIEHQSDGNLSTAVLDPSGSGLGARNLVYVIYTSGSTGRPKGTAMAHLSMVNLIEWHRGTFSGNQGRRVLQFAALSFDVAFQETFSTLCTGGVLVLINEWVRRDARTLAEFLDLRAVERLFLPPMMLQSLAESCQRTGRVPGSLREVITAGEQLCISPEVLSFFRNSNGAELHNHYGPTESHVVTALSLRGNPEQWPALPAIGRPIANTLIYVLDELRQPAPIGVAGEIFIGGVAVARGYLGKPELTQQRFIPDPFSGDPLGRLYKTGDVGRWRADGVLEYLGRNDDQVKIRGHRIELGEIEAQLAHHEQVKKVAVVVREIGGEKRLVAYLTSRDEGGLSVGSLRAYLKVALPQHMVPSAFVILDRLPMTPSGKLDRRSLPLPDVEAYSSRQYEAPQGQVEKAIAGIWETLLRVTRVGREDKFFELGGHSLLATRVISRVRELFEVELSLKVLFEAPMLADFAARVEAERIMRATQEERWVSSRAQDLRQEIDQMEEEAIFAKIAELEKELNLPH